MRRLGLWNQLSIACGGGRIAHPVLDLRRQQQRVAIRRRRDEAALHERAGIEILPLVEAKLRHGAERRDVARVDLQRASQIVLGARGLARAQRAGAGIAERRRGRGIGRILQGGIELRQSPPPVPTRTWLPVKAISPIPQEAA